MEAVSMDVACSRDMPCSQTTQAAISTATIGTQCSLGLLTSSSSQTCEEFPVLQIHDAQAGASFERLPASRDGADIMALASPYACYCRPHFGNTRIFSNNSEGIQFGGELYSCLPCQQRNRQSGHVKFHTIAVECVCAVDMRASPGDRAAERRVRRTELQRKRRQAERERTDPEVIAKRRARAEQERLKARARRAQETPEERARRLATMRACQARRHSQETPEQREARLKAHRRVLREARKRKAEQSAWLHAGIAKSSRGISAVLHGT